MTMDGWRWRIALAVLGLVVIVCSICLMTASTLRIRRVEERDVVPIEVPSSSGRLELGVV
ncbi:MAG: hypothetical protein R6X31_06645 [Anaerolineae bacterium]